MSVSSKRSIASSAGLVVLTALLSAGIGLAQTPATPPVIGNWTGTLDVGPAQLHLGLHITGTAGALHATLDSLDQGANGIPIDTITFQDATLHWDSSKLHATYAGKLSPDGTTLTGQFTQGRAFDLNFQRAGATTASSEPRRPQNPVQPYPYRSEDVTYTNPAQHDVLAATLTLPAGKGPFPAVLLITGSGPQDRDESLLGQKPFLVLSDYLTRRGIAVLRADDRGIGRSTGDFGSATTADFATDAEAGIAFLKSRSEVDPKQIGLIGHSEGGLIAPMIAARNRDVAFIVLLAGPGTPGSEILAAQTRLIDQASGMSSVDAEKAEAQEKMLLHLVVTEKDPAALDSQLHELLAGKLPPDQIAPQIRQITSPWARYFLAYDPAPALRQVKCPVLALDGSKDLQVPPEQNLAAIRSALTAGGNTHFQIVEFPNLNHLFQTATTGSPREYGAIEETFAPVALKTIADWIAQQTHAILAGGPPTL